LSGEVQQLDKVPPPLVRVFGPSTLTRLLRVLQRRLRSSESCSTASPREIAYGFRNLGDDAWCKAEFEEDEEDDSDDEEEGDEEDEGAEDEEDTDEEGEEEDSSEEEREDDEPAPLSKKPVQAARAAGAERAERASHPGTAPLKPKPASTPTGENRAVGDPGLEWATTACKSLGWSFRNQSSNDMAFPHPQASKDHDRKKNIPGWRSIAWKFFKRTIDVTHDRNGKDEVNPAKNGTCDTSVRDVGCIG
jgi:hypothetical protein